MTGDLRFEVTDDAEVCRRVVYVNVQLDVCLRWEWRDLPEWQRNLAGVDVCMTGLGARPVRGALPHNQLPVAAQTVYERKWIEATCDACLRDDPSQGLWWTKSGKPVMVLRWSPIGPVLVVGRLECDLCSEHYLLRCVTCGVEWDEYEVGNGKAIYLCPNRHACRVTEEQHDRWERWEFDGEEDT